MFIQQVITTSSITLNIFVHVCLGGNLGIIHHAERGL